MKPLVVGAVGVAVGAAVASAVLITVYEGKVSVAPSGGAATSISAGEQARVEPGGAVALQRAAQQRALAPAPPDRAPEGQLTREQLIAREATSQKQIALLQARVQQLERDAQVSRTASDGESAPPEDADLPQRGKTHDFTNAEKQAMANHCEVRIDMPQLEGDKFKLTPDQGASLHLAEDQQQSVAAAINKVRDDAVAHLRALYLEATGDAGGAQVLAPSSLGQELLHKSRPADVYAARVRVARERAGIEAAPSDPAAGTVPERYFRYLATIGDSVQRELEPIVGVNQAGVVRDRVDGNRMTMNGCKDSSAPQ